MAARRKITAAALKRFLKLEGACKNDTRVVLALVREEGSVEAAWNRLLSRLRKGEASPFHYRYHAIRQVDWFFHRVFFGHHSCPQDAIDNGAWTRFDRDGAFRWAIIEDALSENPHWKLAQAVPTRRAKPAERARGAG